MTSDNDIVNKFVKSTDSTRMYLGTIQVPETRIGSLKPSVDLPVTPPVGLTRFVVTHTTDIGGCGEATIIDADANNLPIIFQCAHCLQIVSAHNSILDDHSVHIFGDESSAPADPPDIVVYALVLFKACNVNGAEQAFIQTARKIGMTNFPEPGTELHCRDFFHGNKGSWDAVTHDRWWVAKQLLDSLIPHRPFFAVGVADLASYPKVMKTSKRERQTKKEHLYVLAFEAARLQLKQYGFLDDHVERKVWLDRQVTPVGFWDGKQSQVGRIMQSTGLESMSIEPKPLLLQTADLVAYIAGRAYSSLGKSSTNRARELLSRYSIDVAHAKWNPTFPGGRTSTDTSEVHENKQTND
jgi:hypothetical protein